MRALLADQQEEGDAIEAGMGLRRTLFPRPRPRCTKRPTARRFLEHRRAPAC